MYVRDLRIKNFRNLADVTIAPDPILNLVIGDNGQGKTSLIESLFYLSTLKSFRTAKTSDLVLKGKEGFLLKTTVTREDGAVDSELEVRVADHKRQQKLNEKPVAAGKYVGRLRTIVFSPESLESVKQGSEARRSLVDQAVFQLTNEAARAQKDYARLLRQRNACLKQLLEPGSRQNQVEGMIEALEPAFLQSGSKLIHSRLQFLDALFQRMGPILRTIMGEDHSLKFKYESSPGEWFERDEDVILNRLRDELKSSDRVRAERALGITLTGPHRHSVSFLFDENDSRIFCSQGQQRALILAFKIAEIVYHSEVFRSYPLLLLDDVLSEFDEKKRRFLIEFLLGNKAQTFVTTTDHTHFLKGSAVFDVDAGRVHSKITTD